MMNCGDQSINTLLLTGVALQTKQIEHTEMKPSCQCRKKKSHTGLLFIRTIIILLRTVSYLASVSEQRQINKSDFCMSYIYVYIYYTFLHRPLAISKSTFGLMFSLLGPASKDLISLLL